MEINLNNYRDKAAIFSDRERGRAVRDQIGGNELDAADEITFAIPDDVYAIASSFILGLLGETIGYLKMQGKDPEDVIRIPEGFESTFREAFRMGNTTNRK